VLVLAGVMGVAGLAACGSGDGGPDVESGGGGDTTTPEAGGAVEGLPPQLANSQLLSAGDELVGLGPADIDAPDDTSGSPPELAIYRSTDTESWSASGPVTGIDFTGDASISAGTGDADGLVLVGVDFVPGSSSGPGGRTPLALTSDSGLAWDQVDEEGLAPAAALTAVSVDRDGSGFVAAGETRDRVPVLVASDDGSAWQEVETTGLEVADGSETVLALGATTEGFVAFGLTECDGCSDDLVAVGWTSIDGNAWRQVDLGPLGEALDQPNSDEIPLLVGTPSGLLAIVRGGSTAGLPALWVSEDGSTWTEGPALDVPDGAEFHTAAALGDDAVLLFAVGDEPLLQRIDPSA
jgi:hypothetical protein